MNQVATMDGKALSERPARTPQEQLKAQMELKKGEFKASLPSHISFEKFQRTVMTAVAQNPNLLRADRQSLMLSCVKAASDGLLPDGRDAALVLFNSKVKDESGKDVWVDKAQYMPMYAGILKKVRQSGELSSVVAHVAYERDKFEYVLGDEEKIIHEPYMGTEARGRIIAAYAIAKLKDGTVVREVMTIQDIEKVRRTSKSGSATANDVKYNKAEAVGDPKGIWKDWYEEMAKKTVFRRLAKWLPQSIDIVEQVFDNDDTMNLLKDVKEDAPVDYIENHMEDAEVDNDAGEDNPTQPDLSAEIEKAKVAEKKEPDNKMSAIDKKKNAVLQSFKNSETEDALFDCWNRDHSDDISEINKKAPDSFKEIQKAYDERLNEIRAGDQ